MTRALLVGWFSFEEMGATAGDLLSRDVVAGWLREAERPFDVATARPFSGGVDWRRVPPADYTELIFVCGPFGNGPPITDLLQRFAHCRRIGVNVSMLQPLDEWNPFDLLLERDSSETARPDLSFVADRRPVPVVGRILVHPQSEYGDRGRHEEVHAAIARLLEERECAVVDLDTRLDRNLTGLRTPEEVVAVIGRMDAVVTTRLHGTVLALEAGVPALPLDPIAGGAKIARQVRALGWRCCFVPEDLSHEALSRALDWCLTAEARIEARRCAGAAMLALEEVRRRFLDYLAGGGR